MFAASDLTALGAMQTLAERGLRVPEDVAVVGFDDVREALFTTPALTTVRQPIDDLGRTMARVLLDRISGGRRARTTCCPSSWCGAEAPDPPPFRQSRTRPVPHHRRVNSA